MAENNKLTASNPALLTLRNVIQKYAPDIQRLIPKHIDGEKIVMIAQAALTKNPDLLNCDPRTVLAGIIQCSIMGLELHSPLHHASLVPFWNSKAGINEAVLMIEYPGLVELVCRGGEVSYVESQPVYANDTCEVEYGTNAHILHRPMTHGDRGRLVGAYSYAKLRDGNVKFHYMTSEDIEKRRAVSKAKDSGPWKSWEEEMYAKTPLRHLCKQLRKTADLSVGLEHENRFDQGITGVVESPNEGGLTLDFLSMNVEAKTIENKENLKRQIEEKTESSRQRRAQQQPSAAATTATPPPPAPQSNTAPARPAAVPPQQAPATAPAVENAVTPENPITDDDLGLPEDPQQAEAMAAWDHDQQLFPPAQPPAARPPEIRSTQPAPPPAPRAPRAPAPPADPLDATVSGEEATELLRMIRAKGIPSDRVGEYLNGLQPPVKLLRGLTVRQAAAMKGWINGDI